MKAFVTGGSGFLGQQIVRKLLERGYEVICLTHSDVGAVNLTSMGAKAVYGDILDRDSMSEAMAGCDLVFHLAGRYEIGAPDSPRNEVINVGGTRNVLGLAHELGVPKIIYTSSVTVYGDTKGQLADETFYQGGPFLTDYDRTKWLAHYKVAQPLIDQGAPIIIVLPGVVYGPADHSLIGDLMTMFYRGLLRFIPAPDFTVTYAHVEDIAEGHILAAEKGRIGENYILAGPAVPLGDMVDFWGQLLGRRSPIIRIPASLLKPFGPLLGAIGKSIMLPALFSEDSVRILEATYMARSDKAQEKLGWRLRSLQEGMSETFRWIAETYPPEPRPADRNRKVAGLALLSAGLLLFMWLIGRKRE